MINFKLTHTDGKACRGEIETAHGVIETPCFMPVGTLGTVKAVKPESVASSGAQILLGNTYHLMLRPGADTVEKLGGLHKFMNWPHPILTDSGGFQVMSLADLRKVTEEGVSFTSHIDGGEKHILTPEKSIEIQHQLDADITMAFDECITIPAEKAEAKRAMELSMRWAKRSKDAFKDRKGYGIFGIVQGANYKDLRLKSVEELILTGFDGYAIGGLAVGEPQETMFEVLDYTAEALPKDKPHYLMGVGKPDDIVGAVTRGVDMFDCVLPTRSGRTGQAFTWKGTLNINNAKYKDDPNPLDKKCNCPTCRNYSFAYLHHLFKAKELLGYTLLTEHNLYFYQALMKKIREVIENNSFDNFLHDFQKSYSK